MQLKHEALVKSNEELKQRVVEAEPIFSDVKCGREDDGGEQNGGGGGNKPKKTTGATMNGERARKLVQLAKLTAQKKAAQAKLESLKANDPQALAGFEKDEVH
jgi:hypothetical protein